MSSLAGALVSQDVNTYNANSVHIDMRSSSFDDISPDTATGHAPKQEEEMGDLFGEDANVDFVHHSRLVSSPNYVEVIAFVDPIILVTIIRLRPRQVPPIQDIPHPPLLLLRMTAFLLQIEKEGKPWNTKKTRNLIRLLSTAWRLQSRFPIFPYREVQTDMCVSRQSKLVSPSH